jgi:hypothetical protein
MIYDVNIDFDEASREWRKNKIKVGSCHFIYKCIAETKSGEPCKNKPLYLSDFCRVHKKKT